jgi:uncharacterized membrane protein (UPF0127 family)
MNKTLFIILSIITLFTIWFYNRHPLVTQVSIGKHTFIVDIAITASEKEKGLGGRKNLEEGHGMLFPFDHKERYSFWMKDMRFPIDIVWIRDNNVIDITKNAPVATGPYLPVYSPSSPANKVLELPAGTADKLGIKIGDIAVVHN